MKTLLYLSLFTLHKFNGRHSKITLDTDSITTFLDNPNLFKPQYFFFSNDK